MAPKRTAARRAGIKTHRTYTVDEVSRALGAAPITIRRWLKTGLPNVNDQKPVLIAGAHLIEFLEKRKAPRQHCRPHECYCVKCKGPRVPALRMAEYVPLSVTTGKAIWQIEVRIVRLHIGCQRLNDCILWSFLDFLKCWCPGRTSAN